MYRYRERSYYQMQIKLLHIGKCNTLVVRYKSESRMVLGGRFRVRTQITDVSVRCQLSSHSFRDQHKSPQGQKK